MTGEQRVAFEQIRALAAPLRLRVKADVSGRGPHGTGLPAEPQDAPEGLAVANRCWKAFERAVAELFGGRRFWSNSGEAIDVESPTAWRSASSSSGCRWRS
jgi:hypothetical protein